MHESLRRIGRDIKNRRHVDAYVVAFAALTFAVLSIIGDIVPDDIRWSLLFAGVSLLVYRIAIPDTATRSLEKLIGDRSAFDENPLPARLQKTSEVWLFAPSGVNFLTHQHCDVLRRGALAARLARPG